LVGLAAATLLLAALAVLAARWPQAAQVAARLTLWLVRPGAF
jgi:hypothetical protein